MALPKLFNKRFLGIDIGTSAVRIVELSKQGQKMELTNYGEVRNESFQEEASKVAKKGMVFFSAKDIAEIITSILGEAKIKTRTCAFSVPDFSSFFTNFKLPPMTKKELSEAVVYEARQHIPLPLDSVTIDWNLVGGSFDRPSELEVILAAIPNEIIDQYKEIATFAHLDIAALEAEVFGLSHALVKETDNDLICIVDIGTQSTTCSIIEKRMLKTSYSFDIAGSRLIDDIVERMSLGSKMGQEIKMKYGIKFFSMLNPQLREKLHAAIISALEPILREVKLAISNFYQEENREVKKIIITGGTSLLPGVKECFASYFNKETDIGNPFQGLVYPGILENRLKEMGPFFSVAVGMAKKGLEIKFK
ncbi:MAG TPA: type IV pilus assembly protein PilM [Candidatus Paceibacterota bacterium]|nr:type IV pilus assembly protein PilM [Candidatus Pacearchaeota archaeon]HRZ50887.1 type IV pilus assembly protein PilM [Candidatus Paceibacterota bacterium]HSA36608.1 type IV pilus assembly protein PilM [Candidatus Paceibacterota bacterium]